jgi:hypothetical protein
MKASIASAALLVSVAISATPAVAARHLSPSGDFTADGKVSGTKNGSDLVPCEAHITGSIDKNGVGEVTGGTFTGKNGCDQLSLNNLPWMMVAKGKRKIRVMNMTFDEGGVEVCGPSDVTVKLKKGVISMRAVPLAGNCSLTVHLATSPPLSIVQ